jgi:WD40 repeat protein
MDFCGEGEKLILASGDSAGKINVWKIANGKCLRSIHVNSAVTCLRFTQSFTVYAACQDMSIRLYGLKSGALIKQFTDGHDSYI